MEASTKAADGKDLLRLHYLVNTEGGYIVADEVICSAEAENRNDELSPEPLRWVSFEEARQMECLTKPVRFVKVKSISQGSHYTCRLPDLQDAVDLVEEAEVGDGYELTIVEMSEREYMALPAFTGF